MSKKLSFGTPRSKELILKLNLLQEFVDGLEWAQAETYEGLCGGFPGFMVQGLPNMLGYLSYGGLMFGDTSKKMGS